MPSLYIKINYKLKIYEDVSLCILHLSSVSLSTIPINATVIT